MVVKKRLCGLIIYRADRNWIGIQLWRSGQVAGKIHRHQLFFLRNYTDCHCRHFKYPKGRDPAVSMDLFYGNCDSRLDRRFLI